MALMSISFTQTRVCGRVPPICAVSRKLDDVIDLTKLVQFNEEREEWACMLCAGKKQKNASLSDHQDSGHYYGEDHKKRVQNHLARLGFSPYAVSFNPGFEGFRDCDYAPKEYARIMKEFKRDEAENGHVVA